MDIFKTVLHSYNSFLHTFYIFNIFKQPEGWLHIAQCYCNLFLNFRQKSPSRPLYSQWKDKCFQRTMQYTFPKHCFSEQRKCCVQAQLAQTGKLMVRQLGLTQADKYPARHSKMTHVEEHVLGSSCPPTLITWQVLSSSLY